MAKLKRKKGLTMAQKRSVFGLCLLIPFLFGVIFTFLLPFLQSLRFSFSEITPATAGGETYQNVGFSHYFRLFNSDVQFRTLLMQNLTDMLIKVPMIIFYSLFIAVLLNKPFHGRNIAKVIFFLPVITTAGVVLSIELSDLMMTSTQQALSGGASESIGVYSGGTFDLEALLMSLNIDYRILNYLTSVISKLYEIIISSGVQITLFLAALQSIPRYLYEASSIEGATAWEDFWKITLPMISPYVLLCAVYSIIDSFTGASNVALQYIMDMAYKELEYGFASAMAWVYFLAIAAILGFLALLIVIFRLLLSQDRRNAHVHKRRA